MGIMISNIFYIQLLFSTNFIEQYIKNNLSLNSSRSCNPNRTIRLFLFELLSISCDCIYPKKGHNIPVFMKLHVLLSRSIVVAITALAVTLWRFPVNSDFRSFSKPSLQTNSFIRSRPASEDKSPPSKFSDTYCFLIQCHLNWTYGTSTFFTQLSQQIFPNKACINDA